MRWIPTIAALGCAVMLCVTPPPAGADAGGDRKAKNLDGFWSAPDIARVSLRIIALLPAASYDNNLATEKEVEVAWGQLSRSLGYRWYYPTLTKDLLRRAFGGDSVLKALRTGLLKEPRVDSLSAQMVCRALHSSAVMSMRADIWEQTLIEWNQTGKPWTRVSLKAALVDSSGRLLWTASGSETVEGPLQQADAGTLGVKSSGLTLQAVTGQGGVPTYQEVLAKLFTRWIQEFPVRPAPAAVPAPVPGSGL